MISQIEEIPVDVRSMTYDDLASVSDIERRSYDFPWSHGVFRDCLLAGYVCLVLDRGNHVIGYSILSVAAAEAHILNLCVDPGYRSLGYGERLLNEVIDRARYAEVEAIFLEVRPSNANALALYRKKGFRKIAKRPAYYQAKQGREDADVLSLQIRAERTGAD
ncbi:MAG: ribosomal protein S18-alanine N-acetyltransferase [Pseudomonadota bacterium]